MPYVDASAWFDTRLCPLPGETYDLFVARIVPALAQLKPEFSAEKNLEVANEAWAAFILKNASEVTVTMKREIDLYQNGVYLEAYWDDWKITEVHNALLPSIGVTYSSLEKAKAVTGEAFKIAKSAPEQQIVFGWANVAIDENGNYPLDWDGDITQPEALEKAAYEFVLKYRATGEQHQGEVKGDLVESVMFTKEKQEALGIPSGIVPEGWWVGFHIPDAEVFAKVKSGEYQMFSVEGAAVRKPTEA